MYNVSKWKAVFITYQYITCYKKTSATKTNKQIHSIVQVLYEFLEITQNYTNSVKTSTWTAENIACSQDVTSTGHTDTRTHTGFYQVARK